MSNGNPRRVVLAMCGCMLCASGCGTVEGLGLSRPSGQRDRRVADRRRPGATPPGRATGRPLAGWRSLGMVNFPVPDRGEGESATRRY